MAKKSQQKEAGFSIGYFPGLDVLRFIAATGVIFHHVAQLFFEKGLIKAPLQSQAFTGSFFLDVFFIISGFLICSILIKEKESGKYSLKNFYMRRIIRIWPLYFLVALVFVVIAPSVKHGFNDVVQTNAAYAFGFAVNFQLMFDEAAKTYSILWSVCVEEHIYLVLPLLIFLFGSSFKKLSFFMLITGLIALLYFSYLHKQGGPSPYYNSLCYFYYFGIGALLAVFHKQIVSDKFNWAFGKGTQFFMIVLLFLYVFSFVPEKAYVFPVWVLLSGFFGGYLVAAASRSDFVLSAKPSLSRFAGNISYAMYLVHIFIIMLLVNWLKKKQVHVSPAQVLLWFPLAATGMAMILSAILHYLYERPILKLKGKYTAITNK